MESLHVYLNEEARASEAFKIESRRGVSPIITLHGHRLSESKEGLFIIWKLDVEFPYCLRRFHRKTTYRAIFTKMAERECGVYEYESAQAELTYSDQTSKEKPHYMIRVTARYFQHVGEILELIKTGEKIRPTKSYEGNQEGKSRAELEEEIQNLQGLLQLRCNELHQHEMRGNEIVTLTKRLLNEDERGRIFCWPLVSRRDVVNKILRILHGSTAKQY